MSRKIIIFNSMVIIYIFSTLNFIFSVALQVFLASMFGTKVQMDSYLVAMNMPIIVSSLILSFEAVFIPAFKNLDFQIERSKLENLISTIFNLLALVLIGISVLGLLLSSKIISILAPGFSLQQKDLTQALFCIMIPSIMFSGLSAFLICVYHYEEKFALAAFCPLANTIVIICTAFLLNRYLGILSLAWGVLFGSIIQFLILFLSIVLKKRYFFVLNIRQKELLGISRGLLWLIINGIFAGLILVSEKLLASNLPEGSISFLGYAGRIISIVALLPSIAIPTVLLPQLSTHYALKDIDKLRDLLSKGIRMTLLCVLPLFVLIAVFRLPLVKLLFERGQFDVSAVNNTSLALVGYLGVLIGLGLSKVITIGFFAIRELSRLALVMIGSFLFYICIAPFLIRLLSFNGLALAYSSVAITAIVIELFILRKRLCGIDGRNLLNSFLKIAFSSLVMGVTAFFIFINLPDLSSMGQTFSLALSMSVSIIVGFIIFNVTCLMLRVDELRLAYKVIHLRIKMLMQKYRGVPISYCNFEI